MSLTCTPFKTPGTSIGEHFCDKIIIKDCYNSMSPKNQINFRVSDDEMQLLKAYCEQEQRSQSDVLRGLVRSLKRFP